MKAEALTDSTIELPEARVLIELPNGTRRTATGFIIREDTDGSPAIIIKAGKKSVS
jgi:hypothetical protein